MLIDGVSREEHIASHMKVKASDLIEELRNKHNVSEEKERHFLLALPEQVVALDFRTIFGNDNKVVLEIGSGRGELLQKLSEKNPNINYLGVEMATKRIVTMLKRFDPERNSNIKLINSEVDLEFLNYLPLKSLEQVVIIHPDPWPKRKHHKKRLINKAFIDKLADVLKQDGEVLIGTDDEPYAKEIRKCFSESDKFHSVYEEGIRRESFWNDIETFFEKKMKKEGFVPLYMKEVCIT